MFLFVHKKDGRLANVARHSSGRRDPREHGSRRVDESVAETLRHFAEGSHQQSEEFKRSEIGEDVQLYPVQIPQHEVQADQEGTR